jgi:hypothetical protein
LAREKIHKHPHYLKGSIFCGQCNDRLGVANVRGNGGIYPYFYCLGRQKRRTVCQFRHILIDEVERRVELLWRRVHLPKVRVNEIRQEARHELSRVYDLSQQELARQQQRLVDLEKQRAKAKEAYYADAMPLSEFRSEQRRIAHEQEAADRIMRQCQMERQDLEEAVEEALALLGDAYELYRQASPTIRRQLNQAVWGPFRVHENDVRADLALPFAVLLRPEVAPDESAVTCSGEDGEEKDHENTNRVPILGRGSNLHYLVELLRRYSNRLDLLEPLVDVVRRIEANDQANEPGLDECHVRSDGPLTVAGRLGPESIQEMIKLYRDGAMAVELAARFSVSLSSIKRILRASGVRKRAKPPE